MHSLTNKRILLGVTGGIAAYKSAEVIRRLQDARARVRVVMTKAAQEFITPLTLQALSGNPVYTDLLDSKAEAAMGHIELARWADAILIAPASADFISKLVAGEGSDLLSTLCLARRSMLVVAPAMNQGMWANSSTQHNIGVLSQRGVHLLGPASGIQACGDMGLGRMLEAHEIVEQLAALYPSEKMAGLTVVITAGPTREAIDPVRYISNHSSGKMGYALAQAAVEAGAKTILISGPVNLPCPDRVKRIVVDSAEQMLDAVLSSIEGADVFIGAAAVADYRPELAPEHKIKKGDSDVMLLKLIKNPDIIATVAALDKKPFTIGFAAETQHVCKYAKDKLTRKNLDMIIANDVSNFSIGFNSEFNAVTVIEANGITEFDQRSKSQLARDIVVHISDKIKKTLS
ncbi:MAG: phosphopantothenoylcysteine decarboxylase/phosphopantothenate--cysteine ligase [Lentisphaeria bacterium]|jgi:phosphopantothenoylcysteine decarboxylase/phosphopantothenate--cysteine ligase